MTAEAKPHPPLAKYRADVRRLFQSMSMEALHFQNARISWNDCIDRQEIDREYDRRANGGERVTS